MRRPSGLVSATCIALAPMLVVLAVPWSAEAQDRGAGMETESPGRGSAEQQRRAVSGRGEPGTEEETDEGPPDIPRRAVPDYDGRPDPEPPPEDLILWIPRVLTWPIHAVVEFVLRRPLGWVLTVAEHQQWDAIQLPPIVDTEPSWGVVPTILVDFGFLTSGGLYLWLNDVLAPGNALRVQVGFGGVDWLRAMVLDRIRLSRQAHVDLRADGWIRPDYTFVGIGPEPQPDRVSRYGRSLLGAELSLWLRAWRASHARIAASVQANEFYDTDYLDLGTDPELTISDAIAQGWYPGLTTLPPGFDGYVAYRQRIELALDTRNQPSESGVRLDGYGELGLDLTQPLARRWARWGAALGGFLDVGAARSLGLWIVTDFATRLGPADVPFTELADLGGRGRMVAFRRGWLIGESAIAASLEYRYPIWIWAHGFVNVSLGNAFGASFDGFAADRLRMSFALGLRARNAPDSAFTLQVGLGTDTFENGFEPAIVRLTAGTQEGF